MAFFKRQDPTEWVPFIYGAQDCHQQGWRVLNLWMGRVDHLIGQDVLLREYDPQLPEGLDANIGDFLDLQERANDCIIQGILKVGRPRLGSGNFSDYTIASINQDVYHEALGNLFANKVCEIGAHIHCELEGVSKETFKPLLDAQSAIQVFLNTLEGEDKQYLDLFYGNDSIVGPRDVTREEILRHANWVYGYIDGFRQLAEKKLALCVSLLPWILDNTREIDLASFNY